MRKRRAPDLTDERIQVVLDHIDGWQGKLTWDLLLDAVEKAIGVRYSRFTFADYPTIANAFALKKQALRGAWEADPGAPRDKKVQAALGQVERYKAKIERLEKENELLLEQFVTWAHNAERKGVTMEMLNEPLPLPQRDRSKVKV
jgi:uncharacterized protein (UPF0335 family)